MSKVARGRRAKKTPPRARAPRERARRAARRERRAIPARAWCARRKTPPRARAPENERGLRRRDRGVLRAAAPRWPSGARGSRSAATRSGLRAARGPGRARPGAGAPEQGAQDDGGATKMSRKRRSSEKRRPQSARPRPQSAGDARARLRDERARNCRPSSKGKPWRLNRHDHDGALMIQGALAYVARMTIQYEVGATPRRTANQPAQSTQRVVLNAAADLLARRAWASAPGTASRLRSARPRAPHATDATCSTSSLAHDRRDVVPVRHGNVGVSTARHGMGLSRRCRRAAIMVFWRGLRRVIFFGEGP